ncbi:Nucleic-acid-binding protein from transposon X-element [Hypsizygus marmoreus]|uniref:Nucleic-acid-binding protein from transposon X-element n=1 Tax=Hypsizygus marmoreus TaxID=39966 RepID=A0A369K5S7_HYPMA|nr:Nucleic-acid-binding protein from transposon X-element [Hypsizygus marmoreus]
MISQSPQSPPSKVADSASVPQGDEVSRKAIAELTKAINLLNERMDGKLPPVAGKNNTSTPSNPQGAKTVLASGPVYKPTAKVPNRAPPSTVTPRPTMPKTPLDSHHPARLIVISRDGSLAQNRLSERQAVALINDRLALQDSSKHLRVASARYNHRSNLILMTREDQTGAELKSHAEKFIDILLPAGAQPNAIELVTDDRRYKVRVNGIWTGRENGRVHTPKEVAEELELNNPVIGKVIPIGLPKWMKADVDLREQEYSSVVLEFMSEDDANTLLATKRLAAYARFCEVVSHADRPPVLQCGNCWGIGHHAGRCKAPTKCRICAGAHSEKDHSIDIVMEEDGTTASRQTYTCANCGSNHPASDRRCPERARAAGVTKERETNTATGGGKTRPPRKKTNKAAQAAVPPQQNGDEEKGEKEGSGLQREGAEKEVEEEADGTEWGTVKSNTIHGSDSADHQKTKGVTAAAANRFAALQEDPNEVLPENHAHSEDPLTGIVPL